MTTDPFPLTANWLLNTYVNDVNAIRFDDERLRAIDAAINEHNVAIEALKAERGALRAAQEERIEARNRQLCTALHVKLDEDGCPVRRQGPPKKERAAEPPALVSPTPDPVLANLIADAERGLAAAGVSTVVEVDVTSGPNDTITVVVAPDSETTTPADAFIDAVSEPEATLLRNGFSREEIGAMKPAMQQKLRELGYNRDNVHETGKGVWEEAPF